VTLNDLSVRALHRLDATNSRLRHGVVEACFYNLRMLAQELPGRRAGNGGFMESLAEALDKVSDARQLVEAYFDYEAAPGVRIRGLFASESHAVAQSLADVESCREQGIPPRDDADACGRFAERVVGDVDDILTAVDRIRKVVRDRRIPVAELLAETASIHRSACEAEGVDLTVETGEDEPLVFADRSAMLSALSELIRNALKYAFPKCHHGERRIALRCGVEEETRDAVISVADTGCGMTTDRLQRVGAAGASTSGGGDGVATVRRIIECEHFGLVAYRSEQEQGTTVQVRLPRRAEPSLAAPRPAEEKGGEATANAKAEAAVPPSSGRKLAAAAAAVVILAAACSRHGRS
jgi:signal transduction histidine kinase